ncbi:MAG TPA: hypothetical protein ENI51_09140 [Candidatus Atribacteria bacterium]|nr:hypothetical protein [Candidatus Atribacteria bacterium]
MFEIDLSSVFNISHVLLVIATFIIGFFAWMLNWSKEAKLEKFVLKIGDEVQKWMPQESYEKPEHVLVTLTSSKYASIRRFIRSIPKKIRGFFTKIPIIVFVSDKESEIDEQVFLIKQTVGRIAGKELLEYDLLFSIQAYYAHKFVLENKDKLIPGTYDRITEEYDKCKYRKHIANLDNFDFSRNVLKTYYSREKGLGDFSLMKYVVLPMIRERSKELKNFDDKAARIEKEKALFLDIITKLAEKKYIVVFIGILPTAEYLDTIKKTIRPEKIEGAILEARGIYLSKLRDIALTCCDSLKLTEIIEVSGMWLSRELKPEREVIWIILKKK